MEKDDSILQEEFKEFIQELTIEICKEVLLERMQDLYSSFSNLKEKYNDLYTNTEIQTNNLKIQLKQLDKDIETVNIFSTTIEKNNEIITKALRNIHQDNKKVIENIINNKNSMMREYRNKIQIVDATERNKFLKQFEICMENNVYQAVKKFEEILYDQLLKDIKEELDIIKEELDIINENQQKVQSELISRVNTVSLRTERGVNEKINHLTNDINNQSNEIDNLKKQLNFLIGLNVVFPIIIILFMTFIFLNRG